MSFYEQLKSDVREMREGYKDNNEEVQLVDKLTLLLFAAFIVNLGIVLLFNITQSPATIALIFLPLFVAAIFLVFRNRFRSEEVIYQEIFLDLRKILILGIIPLVFVLFLSF